MTPARLARLHAATMTVPAPWNERDFADLLAQPGVFLAVEERSPRSGFALGRVVLDEAELLTIVVSPDARRQGLGAGCLAQFEATAEMRGARIAHLEVASTNVAALALYARAGWQQTGLRRSYYHGPSGRIDAILMQKALNPASGGDFSTNSQDSY